MVYGMFAYFFEANCDYSTHNCNIFAHWGLDKLNSNFCNILHRKPVNSCFKTKDSRSNRNWEKKKPNRTEERCCRVSESLFPGFKKKKRNLSSQKNIWTKKSVFDTYHPVVRWGNVQQRSLTYLKDFQHLSL